MQKIILTGAIALSCLSVACAQVKFIDETRIKYDGQCFVINGKDTFVYSGAFHYFRCPQPLWADRFSKIKAAGFNTVETYIPWNYHEKEEPDSLDDYTKIRLRECQEWIQMAIEKFGLNVIVRPGPYICSEWDSGGYPQWLMKHKPEGFKGDWLRSSDPTYLAWSRHWYRAVCRALERFQITRRPAGKPGIIMFQLENEYDYAGGSDETHIGQLKALMQQAVDGGIEVPFVTCWTRQIRGSKDPLLSLVMDSCNFYPRWNVDSVAGSLAKLKTQQPGAPEMVMELQGGWFSENGGKLAEDQGGLTAAQINNLTLYCIQNGVTATNYYMLFGGTNFGDRTPPNITTSYDYFAPIREDGAVGEKYKAVAAIGAMLKEYGSRFARSTPVEINATTYDPSVKVALRFDPTGGRIIFVRNTSRTTAQSGEASFPGMSFRYDLLPFGSKILYVPKDVTDADKGTWLPKPVADLPEPPTAGTIRIPSAMRRCEDGGTHWEPATVGVPLYDQGVYNAQYVAYNSTFDATPTDGALLWIKTYDNEPVVVRLNGNLLMPTNLAGPNYYAATGLLPKGNHLEVLLENPGYANGGPMDAPRGLESVLLVPGATASKPVGGKIAPVGTALKLGWTADLQGVQERWYDHSPNSEAWSSVWLEASADIRRKVSAADAPADGNPATHLMAWYSMEFQLPAKAEHEATRRLLLDATGNGFIYLNGHQLGRFWQKGPQREYYMPETWLNFDGKDNHLALCLRPVNGVEALRGVEISAYPDRRKE
jgi:hypothetical protein